MGAELQGAESQGSAAETCHSCVLQLRACGHVWHPSCSQHQLMSSLPARLSSSKPSLPPAALPPAGFISIPHDFSLSDLKPRLQALLGSGGAGQAGSLTSSADEFRVCSAINGGSQYGGGNGNGANGSSKGSNGAEGAFTNGSYTNGTGAGVGAGAKQGAFATSGASSGYSNGSTSGKGFGRDATSSRGSGGNGYRRSGRDNGRASAEGAGAFAGSTRGGAMSAVGRGMAGAAPAAGTAALCAGTLRQRMRQASAPPPPRRTGVAAAVRPAARQLAGGARLVL